MKRFTKRIWIWMLSGLTLLIGSSCLSRRGPEAIYGPPIEDLYSPPIPEMESDVITEIEADTVPEMETDIPEEN